jgi:4'-phosphopantetheinyl transferase
VTVTPALTTSAVHVWWASVAEHVQDRESLCQLLRVDEPDRAHRFKVEPPRQRFVVARAALRAVLASYLGAPPDSLVFAYGAHGKPFLAPQPDPPLHFNVSHSGDTVVIAVSRTERLGIDIEEQRPVDAATSIAARFFAPAEAAWLRKLPQERLAEAFFHLWTAKEAYVKALGSGMSHPVSQIEIARELHRGPRLLRLGGDAAAASAWTLLRPQIRPHTTCTVAAQGAGFAITTMKVDRTFLQRAVADLRSP